MTVITGWSALTSAGVGVDDLRKKLDRIELADLPLDEGNDIADLYAEPMPAATGHALPDFSAREHLGRKGTSSYDRVTGLAVVCGKEALAESGLVVDDESRARVGVVLGTSLGSFKSTSDFTAETLTQDKPYLVNPMLFPNTVMNGAAGQMAIRFGLRGPNVTIAGGALAMLNALRYADNALARGYADVFLAGAVEELTPHRAWAAQLTGKTDTAWAGEAAGFFVLARQPVPRYAGARRSAEILSVATGFGPGGDDAAERALAGCVARAVRRAAVDPAKVAAVFTGETDARDQREYGPVQRALGRRPARVMVKRLLGECDAASGALSLAVLLAADDDLVNGLSLLTARGADGAVGAAIVRRCADGFADRE